MTQDINNPVYVSLEFTPNPNTLKYTVNRSLLSQSEVYSKNAVNFTNSSADLKKAEAFSPFVHQLFQVEGISGVMLGKDFVTVTKAEDGDWDHVHKSASQLIQKTLEEEKLIVDEKGLYESEATSSSGAEKSAPQTETEQKICEVLDHEIRPAVAMDGGDITFERYADGVVYLQLKGACSGCPSSTMTLKMGIENRLKQILPEIKEVVSV